MATSCFIFLFLFVAAIQAKKIEYTECGGKVTNLDVTPCEEEPCTIKKGEFAIITATCLPEVDANKLRLTVWADLDQIKDLPYPGMKRDACRGKNITCPITKGQPITYVQKFEVKKFFPSVEAKARFILKTNDGKDDQVICCFEAPVNVV